MKKYLFLPVLIFAFNTSFSQFSAGYSNASNLLTFKIRPSVTITTGFSVMEFFVRYPTNSPAFTYGPPVANLVSFPGMTSLGSLSSGSWEVEHDNAAYALEGYHVDHIIYTAPAPASTPVVYNANQEYNVVSFPLIGNNGDTVRFQLIQQDPEISVYLALTSEVGADLRAATLGTYFYPVTSQEAGPSGSTIYYTGIAVPLPVKFTGFNALKRDKDAMLTWQVENESALTDRYEIERSLNGTDFRKVYTIPAKNNGQSSNTYNLTDLNLSAIRASGVFYYHVKQIDKDGRFVYSDIKNIRLNAAGLVVGVSPNPVREIANLTMDSEQDADVIVTISDASGKQVKTVLMQIFKGQNTKPINMVALPAGSYLLKIQTPTETKTIPVIKTR